jgi:pimeloyl-ACP methyl ester carboxylesterase
MTDTKIYRPVVTRRTRSLRVRNLDYCVNEWGDDDAPLIFYLHGWADTGSTFQFVVDALASSWRVVAPDWRGFGRTAHSDGPYWFPDYLADLHEVLKHYSPDEPVNLVGHSMGGNVASLYAGSIPERVKAVINVEGFGLVDSDPDGAPQRYRGWLEAQESKMRFSEYADFAHLAGKIRLRNGGLSEAQAEFVAREWASTDGDGVTLRADPKHKMPNAVLYRRAETEACWRNITASVLLVSGDNSPFARQFGDIATMPFPGSEAVEVSGVGHMVHFEAPESLAEQIEQFLKKAL